MYKAGNLGAKITNTLERWTFLSLNLNNIFCFDFLDHRHQPQLFLFYFFIATSFVRLHIIF